MRTTTTRTTTTRTALTALALAGALGLGACSGGGSTTSAPAGATSSAPSATTPASSSTSTTTSASPTSSAGSDASSGETPAAGSTVPGTTFGTRMLAAMRAAGSGRATMTITQGTGTTTLAMDFVFGSAGAMQAHATMSGGALGGSGTEVVVTDGATYVKLPKAVGGKTWFKTTGANAAAAADPTALAKTFSAAKVVFVGTEGGLQHYTITTTGVGAGTVQAYLDAQGRPSKVTGSVAGSTLRATYADWGTPVTVTAPPASQVTTTMG